MKTRALLKPFQPCGVSMNPKMTAISASGFLNITVQYVHKQLRSKNLNFEKNANRVYFGHETSRALFNLKFPDKPKVISVQIVKGGPGKTSVTKNIGIRAALYGARVLLIDLDQQGNLTNDLLSNADQVPVMMDLLSDEELSMEDAVNPVFPGLDLIASRLDNSALDNKLMFERFPLDRVFKDRLDTIKHKYDLILIDCPPALSQSVAAAALASDLVIAPVAPEKYCLDGLKMTQSELRSIELRFKTSIAFRIVLNKFDSRTSLSHEILEQLHKSKNYGEKLYKTYLRNSQEFANTTANRESIYDSLRVTPAQEDIDLLTREILDLNSQRPKAQDIQNIPLGTLDKDRDWVLPGDQNTVPTQVSN